MKRAIACCLALLTVGCSGDSGIAWTARSLKGTYLGSSSFEARDAEDSGYSDVQSICFVFTDSTYWFEPSDTVVEARGLGFGGGPYEQTASQVSLNGYMAYVMWPPVNLRGQFEYRRRGDTLIMMQEKQDFPAGSHYIRLVRQRLIKLPVDGLRH